MIINYTPRAQQTLRLACKEADSFNHNYVGTEHLLLGLIKLGQGTAVNVLQKMGLDLETVRMEVEKQVGSGPETKMVGNIPYTPRVKKVLALAGKEAKSLNHSYVGTEHILLGLLREGEGVAARVLKNLEVDIERTRNEILKELDPNFTPPEGEHEQEGSAHRKKIKTPKPRGYGRDLTKAAQQGMIDPVFGRDNEISRILQVFLRRTGSNPVLIGERGVGKTAIVEGLSMRIASGDVPDSLADKRIVALDLAAMMARAKSRSEFSDLLKAFLKEIAAAKEDTILFIDELHAVVGDGAAEGAMDASAIIKTALNCGEIQCIGATTLANYRKHIGTDAALDRHFQILKIEPPSLEETIEILKCLRPKYTAHHKVHVTDSAIEAAVNLSDRYLTGRFLPDKAIDIMDEAAAKARVGLETRPPYVKEIEKKIEEIRTQKEAAIEAQDFEKGAELRDAQNQLQDKLESILTEWREKLDDKEVIITEKEIAEVISSWTGVPVSSLS